jgi:G3E family GTPase
MKLYLINGFLGSGKTTAIQMACDALLKSNKRVGVITNDQGDELVDTAFLQSHGVPSLEVTGGCFCCNYEKLSSSISALQRDEHPDIIFAESVGSCTDLIATVAKPLKKFYPDLEIVISVFADAGLLYALITNNASFISEDVHYVFKKQLAEADILVVNKVDSLSEEELDHIKAILEKDYNDKSISYQNSLDTNHINIWLNNLENFRQPMARKSLQIDYDVYARGEAMLAWFDQKLEITTTDGSAPKVAAALIREIFKRIIDANYLIGHLKYLVDDGKNKSKISYTSMSDQHQHPMMPGISSTNKIHLLINARIQSTPEQLAHIVSKTIDSLSQKENCIITINKTSSFKPGYPTPQYRIAD